MTMTDQEFSECITRIKERNNRFFAELQEIKDRLDFMNQELLIVKKQLMKKNKIA